MAINHSFDFKQIAQYESEEGAITAQGLARKQDMEGKLTYHVSYSPSASRWLVSVFDGGNHHGYLHPILDEQ